MNLALVTMSVTENLALISSRVASAFAAKNAAASPSNQPPRLVAVSKTKPKEMIIEAYNAGHRHFGENYIQELVDKSGDEEMLEKCPEIKWHFIGNCQTNKAGKLMKCPNLSIIETVTSTKLASKLDNQVVTNSKVGVFVQVNTSAEANKNGLEPSEVVETVKFILEKCPNLKFNGLMTIGNLGNSLSASSGGENPDFSTLVQVRKEVSEVTKISEEDIELSMGMSNDFEEAIKMGSTNVRVGSSIFGARNYPAPAEAIKESKTSGGVTNGGNVEVVSNKMQTLST